jgi:hypothetical protein
VRVHLVLAPADLLACTCLWNMATFALLMNVSLFLRGGENCLPLTTI